MMLISRKYLVLGVSKSGYAVCKYLLGSGVECYIYEEKHSLKLDKSLNELTELGAVNVSDEQIEKVLEEVCCVIISPGVAINHHVAVSAKQKGIKIIGELEFGFDCLNPCIVAVTGTNGKTTTCTMINAVLQESNKNSVLIGNVGVPVSSKINDINRNTVCVTEVSSFQLESVHNFKPFISCVLNIAPDHLERHYSLENYIFLKKRILKNQSKTEYCVLNFDDETVKAFQSECLANIVWVSTVQKVNGAYLSNGKLFFCEEEIMEEKDIPIYGLHNVYNSLFCIAVCKILGVNNKNIKDSLMSFKGVKHRIEYLGKQNGVSYYNDSKATNVASTITALDTMQNPTVLILGGSEKGESYRELFKKIKERPVKHVILTGASRYHMLNDASSEGLSDLTLTPEFEHAVKIAKTIAKEGDTVLLSPACASFDCFNGYEERGERFVQLIGELQY